MNTQVYNKKIKQKILDNCLIDKGTHLIGTYKSFNISIRLLVSEPQINIRIGASKSSDSNNEQLNNWLQLNAVNFKDIVKAIAADGSILLTIKRPFSGNRVPDLINYNVEVED